MAIYNVANQLSAIGGYFIADVKGGGGWFLSDSSTQIRYGEPEFETFTFANDSKRSRETSQSSWHASIRVGSPGEQNIFGVPLGMPFVEFSVGDSDDTSTIFEGNLDPDEFDAIDTKATQGRNDFYALELGTTLGVINLYPNPFGFWGLSTEPFVAFGLERSESTNHFWTNATNGGEDYFFSRSETNTDFTARTGLDFVISVQGLDGIPIIVTVDSKWTFRGDQNITVPGDDELWRFGDQLRVMTGDQVDRQGRVSGGVRFSPYFYDFFALLGPPGNWGPRR